MQTTQQLYPLLEQVGRGQMGCVYNTHNNFVIKKLPLNERSNNELTILKYLSQFDDLENYISKYHTDYKDKNYLYIVMSKLSGRSLAYFKKHELSCQQYKDIAQHLIKGLSIIHSHGVIHRDIKLENIMIDQGMAKYIDFGLSCFIDDDDCLMLSRGTMHYISPEMITLYQSEEYPEDIVDKLIASDVWALGITLYYLVNRDLPFISNNQEELMEEILYKRIISISLCIEMNKIINLMLTKEYFNRPTTEKLIAMF